MSLTSPFRFDKSMESKLTHPESGKYYKDKKIYLEFVQTGTDEKGKAIGSIKPVVRETEIDIDELIQSHADEVGLKNLIMMYARTGDNSIFNARKPLPSGDYSDVDKFETPEVIYARLPDELKKGRTYEQFLQSLTADEFKAFVEGLQKQQVDSASTDGGNNNE